MKHSTEQNFDREKAKSALNKSYEIAGDLGKYQEPVEEALGKVEVLTYDQDDEYSAEEVSTALEGLAELGEISNRPNLDTMGDMTDIMNVLSSHPDNPSVRKSLEIADDLESMEAADRIEQANEYSHLMNQVGESIVEEIFEPLMSEKPDESVEYEEYSSQDIIDDVSDEAAIEEDVFERAARSYVRFKAD